MTGYSVPFSVGQEDKTYEERAGKNEVISENIFTTPVTTQQKVLDLKRKTRTDAYGITFLGADFFNKPTTDSSSDNECFVINVVDDKNFSAATISIGNDGTMVFITQLPANILLGARFQLQNTNNGNNGIFTVKSVSGNIVTVNEATIAEAAGNAMIYFYAKLINRNYNPVSGVPPTYFNLKYTPMRTLLASQGSLGRWIVTITK